MGSLTPETQLRVARMVVHCQPREERGKTGHNARISGSLGEWQLLSAQGQASQALPPQRSADALGMCDPLVLSPWELEGGSVMRWGLQGVNIWVSM